MTEAQREVLDLCGRARDPAVLQWTYNIRRHVSANSASILRPSVNLFGSNHRPG